MKPRAAALAFALAALLALSACSEVTESQPLPWLKVKKTYHKPIGGLGGGTSDFEYYTKRFGFWWMKVDETATGTAIALDPNTAAISTAQGLKLIARGEDQGTLACGTPRSAPSVVAQAGVIDCFDVVAGPAAGVATQMRWRRISGRGEALVVEKVSVESPGRLFARAMASFYDAGHQPYFVTVNADGAGAPECALVWIAGGERRSIAAPADLQRGRCSDVAAWTPLLKRNLRKP
jgi:hypothetical protein